MQLLTEALVVGLLLLIIAIPVMKIAKCFHNPNKHLISTMVIGMFAHFAFKAYHKYENTCDQHEELMEAREWGF